MRETQSTIPSTSFTVTLNALGVEESLSRSGRDIAKVSLRISTLPAGRTASASPQSFVALVQVSPKFPSVIRVVLPDGSRKELLHRPEEVFLLPPRSMVTNVRESRGEIVQYQIPRGSLRAFARLRNFRKFNSLGAPSFALDSTMTLLSRAAHPLLFEKRRCAADVAEYFTLSLYSHLLDRYGVEGSEEEHFIGGFSPQHKRIVCEVLSAYFNRVLSMDELARKCDLSVGHFARAFRQSFGSSFHKYLLKTRIKRAQTLLLESDTSLAQIAREVGYADQPTFTESFTRVVGIPPGRYRRRFGIPTQGLGGSDKSSPMSRPSVQDVSLRFRVLHENERTSNHVDQYHG